MTKLVIRFRPTEPTHIVAVFDWEMATIGEPLMDLGTALGYWIEASETELLPASAVGPTNLPGCLTRRPHSSSLPRAPPAAQRSIS